MPRTQPGKEALILLSQWLHIASGLTLSSMIIPALVAFLILGLEPLLLSSRIYFLIPASLSINLRDLVPIFFRGQLLANFSVPTLGDVYRFKKIGDLKLNLIPASERIQWIAIERLSESITLPLLGLIFSDLAAVKKLVPVHSPLPIIFLAIGIIAVFLFTRKKRDPSLRITRIPLKGLLIAILLSASGWTMDLLALKALTFNYGIPISELILALIAVSFSSIPPLPWGRWGLYEGILGSALHQAGLPIEAALTLATFFHILTVAPFCLVTGGLWLKSRIARSGINR